MPYTAIPLTIAGLHTIVLNAYQHGKRESIGIASDTDIDIGYIDVRGAREKIIQIANSHASNGLIYTLYGTAKDTVPSSFDAEEWEAISGATGTVAINSTETKTITAAYSYILVRAKRQTAGQNSQIDVHYRGER